MLPGTASIFDSLGMVRSAERLQRIAADHEAEIWFGHDPDQFRDLIKAPDGFYQ
jgi:hypothetical protein